MNSVRKSRLSPSFKCAMVPPRELTAEERREMEFVIEASRQHAFVPIQVTELPTGGVAVDVKAFDPLTYFADLAPLELHNESVARMDRLLTHMPRRSARLDETFVSNGHYKREAKKPKDPPKVKSNGLMNALLKRI